MESNSHFITIGTIKAFSLKENNKYSICLINGDGEAWYSDFGKPKFNKGDTIKIEYEMSQDSKWRNIIKIELIETVKPILKPANEFKPSSISQDNARITMRESYIKDIVVALINNKDNISLEDATDVAIICFNKIVRAVAELK